MIYKEPYDIIIEKTEKEWYSSMVNGIKREKWEAPQYSGGQIEKAGKVIANLSSSDDDLMKAMKILNNWRASHAYPLQVITNNLRRNNSRAIVVQRLKRLESIVGKLERYPDMNLYRMQDLGGCRVIVPTINDVQPAIDKYKNSKIRHILKREYDYITNPKKSGYRCYHMVYQFHSDDNETYNKNMLIEIQFRTQLQHIWATAIEMMGIYTKTALKASIGDADTLRFFVLVSSMFALMEGTPVCPDTSNDKEILINEIREIDKRTNIVSQLSALSVAIKHTDDMNQKKGYYILILDYSKKIVKVKHYFPSQIELATQTYNNIEASCNKNVDVVLVSADSFDTVKTAYPNYFVDISYFIDMMRKILE